MGDMADFYNECYMEDFYGEYDSDPDWSIPPNPKYTRKEIYCGHCNKKGLNWKPWKDSWVLFEKSGVPDIAYQLIFLKKIANDKLIQRREQFNDRMFNRSFKFNGIKRIITLLSNEQLIDLYERWIAYAKDENGYRNYLYENKIEELRLELLKRLNKL